MSTRTTPEALRRPVWVPARWCEVGRSSWLTNPTIGEWAIPCVREATTLLVSRCADQCGRPSCNELRFKVCGRHAALLSADTPGLLYRRADLGEGED